MSMALVIGVTALTVVFWGTVAISVSLYCGFQIVRAIQVARRWYNENS